MKLVSIVSILCVALQICLIQETKADENILIKKTEDWVLFKSKNGVVEFRGKINSDSVDSIINYFEISSSKHEGLTLSSNGGHTIPALRLGKYINKNRIPLNVGTICASACAYFVLPSSPSVSFSNHAIIGLHQAPSMKHFERLETVLTSERYKNNKSVTKKQRQNALKLIRQGKNEVVIIKNYYLEIGLFENALLNITNLHTAAKKSLKNHKQSLKVRSEIMIVPDHLFLKNCLGLDIPSWENPSIERLNILSKKHKYNILGLDEGSFVFKGEIISKSDYENCFVTQD
jgi:hypothetical protein